MERLTHALLLYWAKITIAVWIAVELKLLTILTTTVKARWNNLILLSNIAFTVSFKFNKFLTQPFFDGHLTRMFW